MKAIRKIISALLVVMMVAGMPAPAVYAAPPQGVMADETPTQAVEAAAPSAKYLVWTDGSTIDVTGDLVLHSRVDVEGTVTLNINEGVTLAIKGGIHNGPNSKLILQGKGKLVIEAVPTYCAGIGGNKGESGGTIEVNDVGLKVQGGIGAAGIGGGYHGSGGTITIKSGVVNATGGYGRPDGFSASGAGIGGGREGSGGNIVIEGGAVTAIGAESAAGIGGGSVGEGGHITITGGTIDAFGGESAAAIGGGRGNHCGVVHIKGGVIKATGYEGPGIGSGHTQNNAPGTIIIDGGDITAVATGNSNSTASGIGSCYNNEGGTITINGGNIKAEGLGTGAGIGGGYDQYGWDITITGGNVEAEGYIGIGSYNEYKPTPLNKKIIISGGRVKATGQYGIGIKGNGVFSTTANGNALIEASNIGAQTNRDEWNGIIYIEDERISQVYGKRVVLKGDYRLPPGKTLTIPKSTVLDIPEGSQLVPGPNAAFHNQGIVNLYGDWNPHIRGDVRIPSTMSMELPQDTVFGSDVAVMVNIAGKAYPQLKGTGEVQFFVGEGEQKQPLGSATLSDGTATFNLDAPVWEKLAIGNNVIEASYSGMKDQVGAAGLIENKATLTLNVIKAEQTPPTAPVVASKTTTSVTLKEIAPQNGAAVEYSKDGGQTWQASPVFEGLTAGTEYSFVARFAETAHYKASAASDAVKARTESLPVIPPSQPTYPPTVPDAEGGAVDVGPARPSAGDTVTVTPKPQEGMVVDQIIVTDKNGNKIEVTQGPNGDFTFKQPSSEVTITVTFKPAVPSTLPFEDVSKEDYFFAPVAWAVQNNITAGVSATEFAPHQSCTRAQMVTFLWRANGAPMVEADMPFTDVAEGTYYSDAVRWAVSKGIVAGTSATTFSPDATVTRAQTVTFLHRQAGEPLAGDHGFTDVADGMYYSNAVAWAVENNITAGTSDTTFSPLANCTRAQIVTFLYRAK